MPCTLHPVQWPRGHRVSHGFPVPVSIKVRAHCPVQVCGHLGHATALHTARRAAGAHLCVWNARGGGRSDVCMNEGNGHPAPLEPCCGRCGPRTAVRPQPRCPGPRQRPAGAGGKAVCAPLSPCAPLPPLPAGRLCSLQIRSAGSGRGSSLQRQVTPGTAGQAGLTRWSLQGWAQTDREPGMPPLRRHRAGQRKAGLCGLGDPQTAASPASVITSCLHDGEAVDPGPGSQTAPPPRSGAQVRVTRGLHDCPSGLCPAQCSQVRPSGCE